MYFPKRANKTFCRICLFLNINYKLILIVNGRYTIIIFYHRLTLVNHLLGRVFILNHWIQVFLSILITKGIILKITFFFHKVFLSFQNISFYKRFLKENINIVVIKYNSIFHFRCLQSVSLLPTQYTITQKTIQCLYIYFNAHNFFLSPLFMLIYVHYSS